MRKKKEVSNEVILDAIGSLDKKVGSLDEKVGALEISNKIILNAVSSLGERVDAMPETMQDMINGAKEELMEEIRPITRAVDKDAEMLIGHEKRITRIESQLVVAKR